MQRANFTTLHGSSATSIVNEYHTGHGSQNSGSSSGNAQSRKHHHLQVLDGGGGSVFDVSGDGSDAAAGAVAAVEGGAHLRVRYNRLGRPMLLPKPTLAAHNGRMKLDHDWAMITGYPKR